MSNPESVGQSTEHEVDTYIRNSCNWTKLPKHVKQMLGNSQREYEKMVVEYSVKNQLRYKGNLIRHVRKNEEQYYDLLINYSRSHLMLFPYHLADVIVKELRVTPFNYYIKMVTELMICERSYDSLPNFTAADCLRLLGVGRNQYIELMNRARATTRQSSKQTSASLVTSALWFGSSAKQSSSAMQADQLRQVLPARPVDIPLEPWWMLCAGCVLEEDIKLCTRGEKDIIDILFDEGPQLVGTLDKAVVVKLINVGLAYVDVPVLDGDYIFVPPLDGFVMNRVMGDYFETLLYKIFVSIDEHTTVREISEVLDIDLQLVKNAVSVFCRLGFARKRVTGLENLALHYTWAEHMKFDDQDAYASVGQQSPSSPVCGQLDGLSDSFAAPTDIVSVSGLTLDDDTDTVSLQLDDSLTSNQLGDGYENSLATTPAVDQFSATTASATGRRIGFIFDSTLTAFLMMGNLSTSLKNHAVTLFEVGKLGEEALDNFLDELHRVHCFAEGEARRYYEHAQALRETIVSLRKAAELDLLRCESLLGLDARSRQRLLQKTYQFLVSMGPLSVESIPVSSITPIHFGPPCSEANSPWMRLLLYELCGSGPVSLLLAKGTRLRRLPMPFRGYKRLLLSTWNHEPGVVFGDTCLPLLNDTLQTSSVMLQAYSDTVDDSEIFHVPFPVENGENDVVEHYAHFQRHPALVTLGEKISLSCLCGYVTFLRLTLKRSSSHLSANNSDQSEDVALVQMPDKEAYQTTGYNRTNQNATTKDPRKVSSLYNVACSAEQGNKTDKTPLNASDEHVSDWTFFDCTFGVPLFDLPLNATVCENLPRLFQANRSEAVQFANRNLAMLVLDFIAKFQSKNIDASNGMAPYPVGCLLFDGTSTRAYTTR